MMFHRRSHRRLLRSIAMALAGLALATPSALAQPARDSVGATLTPREQQALAARGTGAPTPPRVITRPAPQTESTDAGFHWGSLALGAAAAAGLIALFSLGAPALAGRRGVRTAR